jgi:AraC-like DNA-binding protein
VRTLKKTVKWQAHLIAVILYQMEAVQTIPLQLPHLSDPRLARIAEILVRDPRDGRTLAQLCRVSGAGKRSVERLFQQEIGMTFGKWRQQLRLMQGMRLLAEGAKVTDAALEAGYSTPSAFISMFKKALGTTPSSYF